MDLFKNVKVDKKANVYFEGKVISRNIFCEDGSKKTLGVMLPGKYEFDTEQKEIMEIISGKLKVLLPDHDEWQTIEGGTSFEVSSSSSFKLEISTLVDYCCSYLD